MSHTDIAAYVLGVLDDRENEAFEEHLFTCARCQVELIEMQIVPEGLDELRPSQSAKRRPTTGPTAAPGTSVPGKAGQASGKPVPGSGQRTPPGKTSQPRAVPGKVPAAARGSVAPLPRTPDPVSMPPRPPVKPVYQPAPALPSSTLTSLLDYAGQARKRNRRNRVFATAAALALIVAGPVITAIAVNGGAGSTVDGAAQPGGTPATTRSTEPGQVRTGGSPYRRDIVGPVGSPQGAEGGVRATITLRDREWGTSVELELYGVTGPLSCQLVAVSRDADVLPVTSWDIPQKGYGVVGFPEPLQISGGVGMPRDVMDHFEVRTADGGVLVTVKY